MRIVLDREKCEGLGMCEAMADDYFDLGDEEHVTVLDDEPDESERGHVNAAVQACPVMALKLEG